ncbi:MAG: sel1 repeat family protein [Pseudomonadota bacterium]|nr:sel1 repeat family protein [Pseudomonadota bacterium]
MVKSTPEDFLILYADAVELAHSGYVPSYHILGGLYESGCMPEGKRLDLAYQWYGKGASEGGDDACYFALGRFFFYGIHVEKDVQRAIELFEVAARHGSAEANIALGYCCLHGYGMPRNIARARKRLRMAQLEGYVIATALLSKVELRDRNFLRSLALYCKSILNGWRLARYEPDSPKLFWLNLR